MSQMGFCGSLVIIVFIGGCATHSPSTRSDLTADAPATRRIENPSDRVLNPDMVWVSPDELDQDFRAVNEPFEKAVTRLGDEVLSNFICDHAALTAAGVKMDLPISVYVKKATGGSALKAILQQASQHTPGTPKLGYLTSGYNTVLITTKHELYTRWVYTRQYGVADLMMEPDQERGKALVELVKESIDPDSWGAEGGKCAVSYSNLTITVTQTHENLEAVDFLLKQVRETYPSQLDARLHPQGAWRKKNEPATKESK